MQNCSAGRRRGEGADEESEKGMLKLPLTGLRLFTGRYSFLLLSGLTISRMSPALGRWAGGKASGLISNSSLLKLGSWCTRLYSAALRFIVRALPQGGAGSLVV